MKILKRRPSSSLSPLSERIIRCKKAGPFESGRQILSLAAVLWALRAPRSGETAAFAECLLNTEGAGLVRAHLLFLPLRMRAEIFRPVSTGHYIRAPTCIVDRSWAGPRSIGEIRRAVRESRLRDIVD